MSVWQLALICGAGIAVWMAWGVPRAVHWVVLGALSFFASTAWTRYGFPYPPMFGALTDFCVWLAVFHYAEKRWELYFAFWFQAMIVIQLTYAFGGVADWSLDDSSRVILLEICNWGALATIWLTAMTEKAGDGIRGPRPVVLGLDLVRRSFHRQRKEPPFTRVR